jgi:hypothetical protein
LSSRGKTLFIVTIFVFVVGGWKLSSLEISLLSAAIPVQGDFHTGKNLSI